MKIRVSARSYLMLLMASISAAFVGLLLYFYQNRISDATDQALEQTRLYSAIASKGIDALHADYLRFAQTLAMRSDADAALAPGGACPTWMAQEAMERRLLNLFIVNLRHEVVCSALEYAKNPAPAKEYARGFDRQDANRGSIGQFYASPNKQWTFPVSYPIKNSDGKLVGSLILAVDVDRLDLMNDIFADKSVETVYFDSSFKAGQSHLASVGSASLTQESASILARNLFSNPNIASSSKAIIQPNGTFVAMSRSTRGWMSLVAIKPETVFGPLRDVIWHQTLILGIFCVFAMVSIWGIANRLANATSVLVRAAGNADALFSSRSTGVREIDHGIAEMKKSSHERAKAHATIELWRSASERTRSGMAILRKTQKNTAIHLAVELCNASFEELSGLGSCVGRDVFKEAANSMGIFGDKATTQEMRACVINAEPANRSAHGMDVHGRPRHVQMSMEPLDIDGSKDYFCITLEDVTDLVVREAQLEKQSTTDSLTNLPNRTLFTNLLGKSIAISQRNKSLTAVAFLDLDHFKFINDSIGHESGDKVIAEVASRLAASVRPGDTVSRFGGDEFGIIFTDAPNLETIASLIEAAREILTEKFRLAGREFDLTFSAGVAVFPDDGDNPTDLMSCADIAMFKAKEAGRGNVQFHSKNMSEAFSERLLLEQALKTALADGNIEFLYQPKVLLKTGQPCGMEALARWNHPELGAISPAKFIPLAEESELIATLGDTAISCALRDAKILWDQGFRNMPVAINVSARQIKEGFIEKLIAALHLSGLPPQAVHVEITESSVMPNSDVAQTFLTELSRLGIKVALDDFGTGWSNMAMLKTLPLSYLKMDRSFIIGLGKDLQDAAIAKAIIGLAQALKIEVIAEGVETQMQAQQLLYLEADQIQGYYVCKPMSIADVSKWLHGGCVFQGAPQASSNESINGHTNSIAPLAITFPSPDKSDDDTAKSEG